MKFKMLANVCMQSKKKGELNSFLSKFFNSNLNIESKYHWEKEYANPIEIAELIGVYADNIDKFKIIMWISLDLNIYIKISEKNANYIIKYLFERYPY